MFGPWMSCCGTTRADLVEDDLDQKFREISRTTWAKWQHCRGIFVCKKKHHFWDKLVVLEKKSSFLGSFSTPKNLMD